MAVEIRRWPATASKVSKRRRPHFLFDLTNGDNDAVAGVVTRGGVVAADLLRGPLHVSSLLGREAGAFRDAGSGLDRETAASDAAAVWCSEHGASACSIGGEHGGCRCSPGLLQEGRARLRIDDQLGEWRHELGAAWLEAVGRER